MSAWWNSPESVAYFSSFFQYATVISTAILGIAAIVLSNRLSNLQDAAKEKEKIETTKKLEEAASQASAALQQQKPRHLSAEQKSGLEEKLRLIQNGRIKITAIFGNSESVTFGTELKNVFESAGWVVEFRHGYFNQPRLGLMIFAKSPGDPPYAMPLLNALNSEIEIKGGLDANIRDSTPILVVGEKP